MTVVLGCRRAFVEFTRRMATSTNKPSVPVVVVLGSTATGKSKLAVDLAKKFDGEVISADSMQVYRGLDILTNKVTEEEMNGVKHHMIGIVDRNQKFDVIHFRDRALPIVEDVIARGKVPVLVGGTNYYIESILWKVLLGSKNGSGEEGEVSETRKRKGSSVDQNVEKNSINSKNSEFADHPILRFMEEREGLFKDTDVSNLTNQELYTALHIVDPERTTKLHPNDRRKILRSLQVRFQTGRKHSELIAEQCAPLAHENSKGKNTSGSLDGCEEQEPDDDSPGEIGDKKGVNSLTTSLGGPLRFHNSFCLWLKVDKQILNNRIDVRVEEMIQRGLKKELDDYMDDLRATNCSELNYEEGILQSIGFKEFHTYLQVDPLERHSENADKLFLEGIARLKIVTKQYAKKQLKWINQRFLRPSRRQVPPVYWLDGSLTDSNWDKNVTSVADSIAGAYLEEKLDLPLLKEHLEPCENDNPDSDLIARTCVTCDNRVFIGKDQWEVHIKSARHRRMLKRKEKPKPEYVKVKSELNSSERLEENHQEVTSS